MDLWEGFTDYNQVSDAVNSYFEYTDKSAYHLGITFLEHHEEKRIKLNGDCEINAN